MQIIVTFLNNTMLLRRVQKFVVVLRDIVAQAFWSGEVADPLGKHVTNYMTNIQSQCSYQHLREI
jgi:hypothetical protein